MLLQMNQREGIQRDDQVAGKNNFLLREVNDQVAAGMRGREMKQLNADAVDGEGFLLVDRLCREVITRRSIRAVEGFFYLFLGIRLRDDGQAFGESGEPVDVIAVAVRENHMRYRFRRQFRK